MKVTENRETGIEAKGTGNLTQSRGGRRCRKAGQALQLRLLQFSAALRYFIGAGT